MRRVEQATTESLCRERDEAVSLLKNVMDYRRGDGGYDFSNLPRDERDNAAYDAWCEIENEINEFLTGIKPGVSEGSQSECCKH